jgi:hypothetical protein
MLSTTDTLSTCGVIFGGVGTIYVICFGKKTIKELCS